MTLDEYEIVEFKFSKLFVEFINTFNLLDSNLRLCIGWFVTGGQPNLAYPIIDKLSTFERIDYLKNVINSKPFASRQEMVGDFNEWLSKASHIRCKRNKYIHGFWRLLPGIEVKIIFEWQNNSQNITEEFSLEEYKIMVQELKDLLEEFGVLRTKYLDEYSFGRKLPN